MARKRRYRGICAIDPSWLGFAITVYIPSLKYELSKCYNIKGTKKNFKNYLNTIDTVYDLFNIDIKRDFELIEYCDLFIIESQFKETMKNLQYITTTYIKQIYNKKIDVISALKAKRISGIELKANHYQNKLEAVNYVTTNQNELICGNLHDKNDNICDTIILLNSYIKHKNIEFAMDVTCNNCGSDLEDKIVGEGKPNSGRPFRCCPNSMNDANCKKAFSWLDIQPTKKRIVATQSVNKRPYPAVKNRVPTPVPKKQAVDNSDILVQYVASMDNKLNQIKALLTKYVATNEEQDCYIGVDYDDSHEICGTEQL